MDELYTRMAEILDIEEVRPDDVLRDFADWDSLTVLSILAMADSAYGVTITPEDISKFIKASDLANFLASRTSRK